MFPRIAALLPNGPIRGEKLAEWAAALYVQSSSNEWAREARRVRPTSPRIEVLNPGLLLDPRTTTLPSPELMSSEAEINAKAREELEKGVDWYARDLDGSYVSVPNMPGYVLGRVDANCPTNEDGDTLMNEVALTVQLYRDDPMIDGFMFDVTGNFETACEVDPKYLQGWKREFRQFLIDLPRGVPIVANTWGESWSLIDEHGGVDTWKWATDAKLEFPLDSPARWMNEDPMYFIDGRRSDPRGDIRVGYLYILRSFSGRGNFTVFHAPIDTAAAQERTEAGARARAWIRLLVGTFLLGARNGGGPYIGFKERDGSRDAVDLVPALKAADVAEWIPLPVLGEPGRLDGTRPVFSRRLNHPKAHAKNHAQRYPRHYVVVNLDSEKFHDVPARDAGIVSVFPHNSGEKAWAIPLKERTDG